MSPPTTRNDEEGRGEPGGARDVKSGSEKKRNGGRAIGNSGMVGGTAGGEDGRGQGGRLCRLFVLCRVAAISHTSSAASGLASELTLSSSPTSSATHRATHDTLSVEILRILESRMEKRTSLRQKKRNREREREVWRAVILQRSPLPSLGCCAHEFYGDAFDFFRRESEVTVTRANRVRVCLEILLDS